MKDDWLIKILIAVIIGLISWSAHREISRLDRSVEVLHMRVNDSATKKADKDDFHRELGYVWKELDKLWKK